MQQGRRRQLVRLARLALALLLPACLLAPTSCVTAAVWDSLPDSRGGKVAAVALTPVTVALDAALFAGWVVTVGECGSCGHPSRGCHGR